MGKDGGLLMRMYDLIVKKRDGYVLSKEEIDYIIKEYTAGNIPDYQISALMMAIYFQGMNQEETLNLTLAMRDSGDKLDLSKIPGIKVDKHSTGGVGDKTSITLTPLVASVGVKVAKMSGRGLGHTGGTIDKLESFTGFKTGIDIEQFFEQVNSTGIAIMSQTKDLAPADKKLYALRDVTATVNNISLIASSVMSKKLASGADAIVLDVKCGSGAFMKDYDSAYELAKEMVDIGVGAGKNMKAFITNMDQPLGNNIGNALEVKEAIATLKGEGPKDFTELCLSLGSAMVVLAGLADSEEEARKKLLDAIESGKALDKLAEFIEAQGGNKDEVYHPEKLPVSKYTVPVIAPKTGIIEKINCEEVGICSLLLGGGRETKESEIDLSVGIELYKKTGDAVEEGEAIACIYYNDEAKMKVAMNRLLAAYTISDCKVSSKNIILGSI